jgi:hypothetical protein
VDISTSTTTDHPNISIHGEPRSGRLPGLERKLPFVRGSRRRCRRSGAEQNRCSTFPIAIARAGTSPRPRFAPGTWCRKTPSLTGLERRGEESSAADAGRTSKVRPPKGRRGAGPPRRGPALTSPRCLPSKGRSRTSGQLPTSRSCQAGNRRLFHHRRGCAGRRPRTLTMARRVDRSGWRTIPVVPAAAPPSDFCVRVNIRSQMPDHSNFSVGLNANLPSQHGPG